MQRIESEQNPKIKRWRRLGTKKGREREKAFLAEGVRLVEEALKSKTHTVSALIFSEENHRDREPLQPFLEAQPDLRVFCVPSSLFRRLSDTETPQGVAAEVSIPTQAPSFLQRDRVFLLILDEVQDPGNVGTMIRTADAAGMDGVVLGSGSADPYNPKVIRSTMGSVFHLPVLQRPLSDWMPSLKEHQIQLLSTSLTRGVSYDTAGIYQRKTALVLGNEAQGVSAEIGRWMDTEVTIPIYGKAESLNVASAAAILAYEVRRQIG